MFFQSSLDILYLALAAAALLVAAYLSYTLYQISRTLRNVNRVFEGLEEKLQMIVAAVNFVKDKLEDLTSGFGMVGEVLAGLLKKLVAGYLGGEGEEETEAEPEMPKKKRRK